MRYPLLYALIIIMIFSVSCKRRYSFEPRGLTIFERITHERTDNEQMESFIDSLILRMTLSEKIGQMTQLNESYFYPESSGSVDRISAIDSAAFVDVIGEYQIGSILLGGARHADEWYALNLELQRLNLAHSANRIPLIFAIDHVHGSNFLKEGTVFPHQLNLGATFNPDFAFQMGRFTAEEAAPLGHHWNFAPVLDVGENKLWPRLYETYGEDTYLTSRMAVEYIKGVQDTLIGTFRMAACAKNFIGYSIPISGWDRTPVEISEQRLQEVFVPPFEEAIEAGLLTVMVNSGEINGVPVHSSYDYLTRMLRDQLQFKGVVITDYQDIIKLHQNHRITENEKESTFTAIMAGIDVAMTPGSVAFCNYAKELLQEDRIQEERIDLSVRRILRLKYKLGLFDNPFPSEAYYDRIGSAKAHKVARAAATESIVLLKNDNNLLPLTRPVRLVVAGVNADSRMALCGGWTYSWQGNDETLYPDTMKTVVEALEEAFDNGRIIHTTPGGLSWHARTADALIIVTGEQPYAGGWGNVNDLNLPDEEIELIETALATGKPVILILLEGRPRIIKGLFDECDAVLFAGLPGMFGAETIAGILKGRINPSAKMPVTYPYSTGNIIPYNHKHTVASSLNTFNQETSRYTIGEFGTGKSYTTFSYTELNLSDTIILENEKIEASVIVKNTGQREGKEAVLWFISDEVASITRPVKQLKSFEKKFLLPGELKEYKFVIDPREHLGFPDENGNINLEPGYYMLSAGPLIARFQLAE